MCFSENLKKLRKKAGMSQSELSKKCCVSQQAISLIEKGDRLPVESTIRSIVKVLGCTYEELMDGEETKKTTDSVVSGLQDEAVMLLRSLPESAQDQAVQYLRFLASQQEK